LRTVAIILNFTHAREGEEIEISMEATTVFTLADLTNDIG